MWRIYFLHDGIFIFSWNAPKSNIFNFGSFPVLKLITWFFPEMPHLYVQNSWNAPFFPFSESDWTFKKLFPERFNLNPWFLPLRNRDQAFTSVQTYQLVKLIRMIQISTITSIWFAAGGYIGGFILITTHENVGSRISLWSSNSCCFRYE